MYIFFLIMKNVYQKQKKKQTNTKIAQNFLSINVFQKGRIEVSHESYIYMCVYIFYIYTQQATTTMTTARNP